MVLEFLDSFAVAEAVEADEEEEAQRIQSNADGRRENNVTREEWREYQLKLLMKLIQMQL